MSQNKNGQASVAGAGRVDVPIETLKVVAARGDSTFHRHSAFDAAEAVIMMVDDEALNIDMTQAFLEDAGYRNFISTDDSTQALAMMRERQPHVLLLDLSMPRVSGLDILSEMSGDEQLRLIPVIVMTSNTDAKSKLGALSRGAMDFLNKPVDPSELALRLRNTLAARAHRDYLAQHDGLTGLRNRARFKADAEAAIAAAARDGHGMALLHVGVDRLGQVNDALGRSAGDALIYRMAKRLRQCAEAADVGQTDDLQPVVYRFDGDEFAMLVPFLEEIESAATLISGVMDAVAVRFRAGDREVFVTASVGVTVFPADGQTADELISNAGVAMRQAKKNGRNTYEFFSPRLNQRAMQDLRMGGDMRRAIGRDELTLLYSPRLDARSGRVVGAEAVVRWKHPSGRIIEGDAVVRMASTSEMSMVLGEWMLDHAMGQARAWHDAGLQVVPLGVNVLMKHFPLPQLMEMVAIALRRGARGEWLSLEMSELSLLDDLSEVVRASARLRELGVHLALDDFGTPGTALSLMQAGLIVSEIKLAPSFMAGIDARGKGPGAAVVQSVLALGQSLRTGVVVTGVDTMHQLAFVKNIGADQYQGAVAGVLLNPGDFAGQHLVARPAEAQR